MSFGEGLQNLTCKCGPFSCYVEDLLSWACKHVVRFQMGVHVQFNTKPKCSGKPICVVQCGKPPFYNERDAHCVNANALTEGATVEPKKLLSGRFRHCGR